MKRNRSRGGTFIGDDVTVRTQVNVINVPKIFLNTKDSKKQELEEFRRTKQSDSYDVGDEYFDTDTSHARLNHLTKQKPKNQIQRYFDREMLEVGDEVEVESGMVDMKAVRKRDKDVRDAYKINSSDVMFIPKKFLVNEKQPEDFHVDHVGTGMNRELYEAGNDEHERIKQLKLNETCPPLSHNMIHVQDPSFEVGSLKSYKPPRAETKLGHNYSREEKEDQADFILSRINQMMEPQHYYSQNDQLFDDSASTLKNSSSLETIASKYATKILITQYNDQTFFDSTSNQQQSPVEESIFQPPLESDNTPKNNISSKESNDYFSATNNILHRANQRQLSNQQKPDKSLFQSPYQTRFSEHLESENQKRIPVITPLRHIVSNPYPTRSRAQPADIYTHLPEKKKNIITHLETNSQQPQPTPSPQSQQRVPAHLDPNKIYEPVFDLPMIRKRYSLLADPRFKKFRLYLVNLHIPVREWTKQNLCIMNDKIRDWQNIASFFKGEEGMKTDMSLLGGFRDVYEDLGIAWYDGLEHNTIKRSLDHYFKQQSHQQTQLKLEQQNHNQKKAISQPQLNVLISREPQNPEHLPRQFRDFCRSLAIDQTDLKSYRQIKDPQLIGEFLREVCDCDSISGMNEKKEMIEMFQGVYGRIGVGALSKDEIRECEGCAGML